MLRQDAAGRCAGVAGEPWADRYHLGVATLFLHHLDAAQLHQLLAGLALKTDAFIACEPRRDAFARLGSRLVGLLGANAVTRSDAVKSVAAGFAGSELSAGWPDARAGWQVDEGFAWPFTHYFAAARHGA